MRAIVVFRRGRQALDVPLEAVEALAFARPGPSGRPNRSERSAVRDQSPVEIPDRLEPNRDSLKGVERLGVHREPRSPRVGGVTVVIDRGVEIVPALSAFSSSKGALSVDGRTDGDAGPHGYGDRRDAPRPSEPRRGRRAHKKSRRAKIRDAMSSTTLA